MSTQPAESLPSGTQTFVGNIEVRLRDLLGVDEKKVADGGRILADATRHLTLASAAKRARPRLVYHFGTALGVSDDDMIDIAIAAELVHTASLLHDDVVDAGTERRQRPTVNTQWDNITAVLAGDSLLCSALQRIARFEPSMTASAVQVVAEMTDSIMHEVKSRHCTDLEREDWWTIAEGKTGALFGWCGSAPAVAAAEPSLAERFDACGRHLGVAFQMADDLKDIVEFDAGKDRYADIRNGNPSFPLICAIGGKPAIGEKLVALWEEAEGAPAAAEIAEDVLSTDAVDETRRIIRREVDTAMDALGDFADRNGGRWIAFWAEELCEAI